MSRALLLLCALALALPSACATTSAGAPQPDIAPGLRMKDEYTIVGKNLAATGPAVNRDDTINVVIEIPSGTNAKWEVRMSDGALVRELVRLKDYTTICSSAPGELLARVALENSTALFAEQRARIAENGRRMAAASARPSPGRSVPWRPGTRRSGASCATISSSWSAWPSVTAISGWASRT